MIRFERPGVQLDAQVNSAAGDAAGPAASSAPFEATDEAEKIAVRIARDSDRVTKKALMEQAGIGRTKATKTLKQLAEKGVLTWVGKGTNDPYQYYRLNESAHDSQLTARGRAVGCYGPDSCSRPLRHASLAG